MTLFTPHRRPIFQLTVFSYQYSVADGISLLMDLWSRDEKDYDPITAQRYFWKLSGAKKDMHKF